MPVVNTSYWWTNSLSPVDVCNSKVFTVLNSTWVRSSWNVQGSHEHYNNKQLVALTKNNKPWKFRIHNIFSSYVIEPNEFCSQGEKQYKLFKSSLWKENYQSHGHIVKNYE